MKKPKNRAEFTRKPDILAKIYLSKIGYQIDIEDYSLATKDNQAIEKTTNCRDFGGSYNLEVISPCVIAALVYAMKECEEKIIRPYLKNKVIFNKMLKKT